MDMQNIGGLDCLLSGASDSPSRVILLHGRGASAEDLHSLGEYLPPRTQGVFPQAPIPFSFGGWVWYDIQGEGFERSAGMLIAFLDSLVHGDPARAAKTILGGFSQGAVMTLDVGLRYRPRLAGLVAMSGYVMNVERAFDLPDDHTPPVCLVHGTHDDVVGVERGRAAEAALRAREVTLRYEEFPIGHEINAESWRFVQDFMVDTLVEGLA
jgi:phospholipase/carboxylesterase